MKIRDYILKLRSVRLWNDSIFYLIIFVILTSIILFVGIELETLFYFSPSKKTFFLLMLTGIVSSGVLVWAFLRFLSINNKIHRYKIDSLSLLLGKALFPEKHDKILNAIQLEEGTGKNESKELAQAYINNISKKLESINLKPLIHDRRMEPLKKGLLGTWIIIILIFSIQHQESADALYRWSHPATKFFAPKPFSLISLSGDIHILGGETAQIKIQVKDANPDSIQLRLSPIQVATQVRDSVTLKFTSPVDSAGIYTFELPELFQDYAYEAIVEAEHFWEAWNSVNSQPNTIFVTDRPTFESFTITVVPPEYSGLPTETQQGNLAVVQGLKGSAIQVNLTSNRKLKSAYMDINGKRSEMSIKNTAASGHFQFMVDGEFTVNLVDERGITNRDPVPYALEMIPDLNPRLSVIKPFPIVELGNDQTIPFLMEIEDDYGFTDLQVAYEVRRPDYLNVDPYVAMFSLSELKKDSVMQTIRTFWNLGDLMLMPEDEVHFHFELSDNDVISGPKKTLSSTFIARVPSLADLYAKLENNESDLLDDLSTEMEEIQDLKDQFKSLELEALKTEKLDWDQQQSLKNAIEEASEQLENMEKMAEALESITKQGEKHELFSPELMDKFNELSDLIQDIFPENMVNNLDNLQEALDNMDMKSLQNALSDLAENMDQIERELDRYLEIFRRMEAEQKMDELQTRMEQLFEQQKTLDEELNQLENNTDRSTLERLAQEEMRNLEEFAALKRIMEEASEMVKPYSQETAEELSELRDDSLTQQIDENMTETMENLSDQQQDNAMTSSEQSLGNMQMMMQRLSDIRQTFQQETVTEMTEKFQALIQDVLYLSSQEEKLRSEVSSASRNSPRLRELAAKQQLLQDQLKSMMAQMMELSKETFAMTPDIGRGVGKAHAGMEEAKTNLARRNVSQTKVNQNMAMEGLNEAAMAMFNSIQQMQQSGSAGGFEQFLKMMQQMAGQQQGLNQQGMQLALGQMTASMQQQLMKQMLQNQRGIKKSLKELMDELRNSGQHGLGDLGGIGKDMDDVIKDLQKERYTRKTQERQQRILSRMLDSQTSLTQRGYKEDRKSIAIDPSIVYKGPSGLPADMGQRQNLALQALNKAINAGYSREHQTMIKRYFNSLSQAQSENELNEGTDAK